MEREEELRAYTGDEPSSRRLKEGVTDYFKEQVRNGNPPAFVRGTNHYNRIVFTTGDQKKPGLHRELDLARVLNLSGLRPVFLRNIERFAEFLPPEGGQADLVGDFRAWLDAQCTAPDTTRERFVDATLKMLNEDRKVHRYHPTWATLWEDFAPFAAEGPKRWRQVVGVGVPTRQVPEPAWLIVLKYKAYEAGEPYRPTQLDAGWVALHFPSPREYPVESGGLAMDLAGESTRLVRELVHGQGDHFLHHWKDAGRLMGLADIADPIQLGEQRERHQALLIRSFGESVRLWKY